jgi:hypothetical protein
MRKKDDIVLKVCLLRNHLVSRANAEIDNMVRGMVQALELNIQ